MADNDSESNQSGTRALNWIFALTITLVACAIGSVAWNCIDSLQKHSEQVRSYHGTTEDIKVDGRSSNLQNEMDTRVLTNHGDPVEAIQTPTKVGSEIPFDRGAQAISKRQFIQAAAGFTEALAMIPAEANKKRLWHFGGGLVDKRLYTASAYEQRACCYMETGHYSLALADLTAAIKLRPDYVPNYKNRAKIYDHLGEKALWAADMKTIESLSKGKSRKP